MKGWRGRRRRARGSGAWEIVRAMMGATNPRAAAPGTIRGDLGTIFTENLVHGSDSAASASRELEIFFPGLAKKNS